MSDTELLELDKRRVNLKTAVNTAIRNRKPISFIKDKVKELRESTGMNRKEFCEYFDIPYRTVTEWERDNRHAPAYVLRLLEYYIRMEKLMKDKETNIIDE